VLLAVELLTAARYWRGCTNTRWFNRSCGSSLLRSPQRLPNTPTRCFSRVDYFPFFLLDMPSGQCHYQCIDASCVQRHFNRSLTGISFMVLRILVITLCSKLWLWWSCTLWKACKILYKILQEFISLDHILGTGKMRQFNLCLRRFNQSLIWINFFVFRS